MGRSRAAVEYNATHGAELADRAASETSRAFFAGWHQARLDYALAREAQNTTEIIRLGQVLAGYQDEFYRTAF